MNQPSTPPPTEQPFNPLSAEPAPPKVQRRILIIAAVAVVLLAVLAIVLATTAKTGKPATFDLTGTIMLTGSTTSSSHADFECEGKGGYSDIGPSTAVTVSDETGTLIAKGRLTESFGTASSSGYCGFAFTVPDVPTGMKYYQVEVSHRGSLSYTEDEAADGVELSLGN